MSFGTEERTEVSDLKIDRAHSVLPMLSISKAG
jgi:hypothetical protein